jgi:serine protease Do
LATWAPAAVKALKRVDFPALGKPMIPQLKPKRSSSIRVTSRWDDGYYTEKQGRRQEGPNHPKLTFLIAGDRIQITPGSKSKFRLFSSPRKARFLSMRLESTGEIHRRKLLIPKIISPQNIRNGGKTILGYSLSSLIFLTLFVTSGLAEKSSIPKASPIDLTTAIADVAQKAMPAVVHIEVTQRVEVPFPQGPFENDPFFRYFFGPPSGPRTFKKEMKGIGSGMILDGEGHILTNFHVVGGASRITVKTSLGEEFEGKVVGSDPKTDLAVIRIKAPKNVAFLTFGDSDRLRVGEWVVAIGNPRGLEQTVTAGIISAKHRTGVLDPSSYQDYIQTDAAINPGNSGGPLLNLSGEVVGINAAIVSESGGFEGIGFAIPSNMARSVAEAVIKNGKVVRGWIGVSVQELTNSLAKNLNAQGYKGALVENVSKGGPAEKGGIKRGDVLISIDGLPLDGANDLRNRLAATRVGKTIEIGLLRKGEKITVQVLVTAFKPTPQQTAAELRGKLGIEVKEISNLEARRKRLENREGVVLSKVDPNSPADRAGLEPGDVLHQINNQTIRGIGDYTRILEQVQSGEEVLLLLRDGRTGEVGYLTVVAR